MNHNRAKYLKVIIILLLSTGYIHSTPPEKKANILVLFAMNSSTPAYEVIFENIKLKLSEEIGDSFNIHAEYLEADKFPEGEYPKEKFDVFNKKYRELDLNLLICVGMNIMTPVRKNADDYLLKLKTIVIDYDYTPYGIKTNLKFDQNTVAIPLRLNIRKTLTEAVKLFPKTTSVFFIYGVSRFDTLIGNFSKSVAAEVYPDKKVSFISNMSMHEILDSIKDLPKNSLVFVPVFNVDSRKITYFNPEAVRLISRQTNAPVFTYTSMGIGEGAVGGYVHNHARTGALAGDIAAKLLNGIKPDKIQVSEKDYYDFIFDARVLEKWELNPSASTPEGSTILFYEMSPFEKYKWLIAGVILFILFQSFLIINLIRLNRNQKVMTKKIVDAEAKYRVFFCMRTGV